MPSFNKRSPEPKDHLLLWAIGISTATFAFFYTVILPIYERHNMNLIADQEDQLNRASEEKRGYQEQLRLAVVDNADLREILQEIRPGLFSYGSPYPAGWEGVKIGSPLSILETLYPESAYTADPADSGGYISITPKFPEKSAVVTSATYYFDEDAPLKTITSILFLTTKDHKAESLEPDELIKVFGRSDMERKEGKKSLSLKWRNVQGIEIEFRYDLTPIPSPLVNNPAITLSRQ